MLTTDMPASSSIRVVAGSFSEELSVEQKNEIYKILWKHPKIVAKNREETEDQWAWALPH